MKEMSRFPKPGHSLPKNNHRQQREEKENKMEHCLASSNKNKTDCFPDERFTTKKIVTSFIEDGRVLEMHTGLASESIDKDRLNRQTSS